jgi:hypothetical protein
VKLRVGLAEFSAPEKVSICVLGEGDGDGLFEGAATIAAVGAETAVAEPALLEAVTATSSV